MGRSFALAVLGFFAGSLVSGVVSGCIVYTEDLLEGGGAGGAGGSGGSAGGGGQGAGGNGCASCKHLLVSELLVTPTRAELVEIFNPGEDAVSLDDVWLADFPSYYAVATGTEVVATTDFVSRFPSGSSIDGGSRVVVAIAAAADYEAEFGTSPDYSIRTMTGTSQMESGLANGNEVVVLFQWDGASATVKDLDILTWGDRSDAVDKSALDGYQPDTPAANQSVAAPPPVNQSLHRCDFEESTESKQGGNGVDGHDETSENVGSAFAVGVSTPKASPPAGICP